ncbi:hypothetical protein SLS54_009928 [Diplodia seriata]
MLKSSRPKGGDAASKEEYNKALKWDKYQTSVRDLFNINIDSQKEPDADAKNQIQKLQDKFSRISQLKGSTGEPKDRKKPRLFCGEQGIPSMPAGETIAEEESEKAKERPAGERSEPDCYSRASVFSEPIRKSKSVNKRIPLSKFDKGDYEKDVDHPCKAGGKAFALTKNDANAIFICDRGMEFQAKLIAPEEGKSMAKTLMKNRALSDTLLHEMFHLFWNLDDVRKVKFAHKGSDEPEWKDEAQRIPERDDDLVYGYLASYQLAKYVPKAASKTVETYVWFAISVFNEDWKFEGKDGEAKKIAWKK